MDNRMDELIVLLVVIFILWGFHGNAGANYKLHVRCPPQTPKPNLRPAPQPSASGGRHWRSGKSSRVDRLLL